MTSYINGRKEPITIAINYLTRGNLTGKILNEYEEKYKLFLLEITSTCIWDV